MAGNGAAGRYRLHAAHCVEFALRMSDPASKASWHTMAQAWLTLADQADKNARAPTLVYETPTPHHQVPQQQQQPQPDKE
jgi:hypothetical protein